MTQQINGFLGFDRGETQKIKVLKRVNFELKEKN